MAQKPTVLKFSSDLVIRFLEVFVLTFLRIGRFKTQKIHKIYSLGFPKFYMLADTPKEVKVAGILFGCKIDMLHIFCFIALFCPIVLVLERWVHCYFVLAIFLEEFF